MGIAMYSDRHTCSETQMGAQLNTSWPVTQLLHCPAQAKVKDEGNIPG